MTTLARTLYSRCASGLSIGAALVCCLLAISVNAAPAHVLIRAPAGAPAPQGFAESLAAWRHSGRVASALLLQGGTKLEPGFTSLALLEFPNERTYELWNKDEVSKLTAPLTVKRADVLVHWEASRHDSSKSIFLVNTYKLLVSRDRYNDFVQGYILPNLLDQRAKNMLVRYSMYLERGPQSEAQAVLVLEYRDEDSYSRRGAVRDELVKKLLASDPAWKNWDEVQDGLRKQVSRTLASYSALPPVD